MEQTDIFRQLLKTEAAARIIHDEAAAYQENIAKHLEQAVESHREGAYEKAEAQIAAAEADAIKEANAQIARLDEEARRHLERLKETQAQNLENWVRQIFLVATYQEK